MLSTMKKVHSDPNTYCSYLYLIVFTMIVFSIVKVRGDTTALVPIRLRHQHHHQQQQQQQQQQQNLKNLNQNRITNVDNNDQEESPPDYDENEDQNQRDKIQDNRLVKMPSCPQCHNNHQNHHHSNHPHPGEETIRKIRLNMIKQQILWKLRLTEPPNMEDMPKDPLPSPLSEGSFIPRGRNYKLHSKNDRDVEDFYGRTMEVIVFPEDGVMPSCPTAGRSDPSACFFFNLPKEVHKQEISSAELWFYKLPANDTKEDEKNQTFWVSEITTNPIDSTQEAKSKNIGINQFIRQKEGWINFNITKSSKSWLERGIYSHSLKIGCSTCSTIPQDESPIDTDGEYRPFILIHIANIPHKRRRRRNINCSAKSPECCRESFKVSFKELGWDNWIIQPAEYDAFYCKGSCVNVNGVSHSDKHHTTVMQKYVQTKGYNNTTAEIVPCCTGTKMSSISIVIRDTQNVNTTLKVEVLPNMIIDSCGCSS